MSHNQPDNAAIQQDIQTRQNTLITDINSGAMDRVRNDMISDAQKYGVVRAQQIYREASQHSNIIGLGFPSGSFLTGVSGDNVIAQTAGRDPQHPQYQERSIHSVSVSDVQTPTSPSGATDLGTRGHSTMTANPDGSGTVKMGGHDALWTVAQKIIEQRQGRATQTDIGNLVNEITAYNRQTNPGFNPNNPPQQFGIPPAVRGETGIAAPTKYDPAYPGSRMATKDVPTTVVPGSTIAANTGDVTNTNPIAPPGLTASPGTNFDDGNTWWRNQTGDAKTNPTSGDVTRTYDGGIYNSMFFGAGRTHFTATETVDAQGHLQHSFVDYTSHQTSMTVKPTDGPAQTLDSVRSIDVKYNPGTGSYTTVYRTTNGDHLTTYTDRNGRVTLGTQANSPPPADFGLQ